MARPSTRARCSFAQNRVMGIRPNPALRDTEVRAASLALSARDGIYLSYTYEKSALSLCI